jgi:alkaline phosphatase D
MRAPLNARGIERSFTMGPLLDVFLLDARSYRGGNQAAAGAAPGAGMYGDRQMAWLKQGLAASRAVWKIIACEMPLTLAVGGGYAVEALANALPGPPGGREAQLAEILSFLRAQGIGNVVWLSADVHHSEAIHCHPDRAAFKDFLPFWEIVTGPINAGTFGGGPSTPDPTFGPEVAFYAPEQTVSWLSPAHGKQFFGMGEIDPQTHALTLSIHDLYGAKLWSTVVEAGPR